MHSTAKTAFSIPWFSHAPAIGVSRPNALSDHRQGDRLASISTDPGQFIIEFLAQFAKLNLVHMGDEQGRQDRLGMLLDSTLDLKIIDRKSVV